MTERPSFSSIIAGIITVPERAGVRWILYQGVLDGMTVGSALSSLQRFGHIDPMILGSSLILSRTSARLFELFVTTANRPKGDVNGSKKG